MTKTLIGNIKGPKGDTGEQGLQGVQGITGETGQRGSRWNTGTVLTGIFTEPTIFSEMGADDNLIGDLYLNPDTGYIYRCVTAGDAATAEWVWIASVAAFDGGLDELKTTVEELGTDLNALEETVTGLGPDTTLSVSGKAADAKTVGSALSTKADTSDLLAKAETSDLPLIFTDTTVTVDSWTTYEASLDQETDIVVDYPYAADITLDGVTANHAVTVSFGVAEIADGVFAPYVNSQAGKIRIYANAQPVEDITIPTITAIKKI